VPEFLRKSLDRPDEVVEFPRASANLVELRDLTVGRMVNEPGWRWSTHVRPTVGGEWCQARHLGVLSGRLAVEFPDGTSVTFEPGDVFDIPPGHDGYTFGDEPCVQVEWAGLRAFDWRGAPLCRRDVPRTSPAARRRWSPPLAPGSEFTLARSSSSVRTCAA
jgi:mannose-6-phosphate isomerase-like protein (cupin superfamily)